MPLPQQNPLILDSFRQKPEEYEIEEFVLDFLNIWMYIHEKAKNFSLEDTLELSKQFLESHTIPFYNKFEADDSLELNENWIKSYASILLKWKKRGSYLFPLKLVTYEICYHSKNLFEFFLQKLLTKEIRGDKESLLEFIFPLFTNFTVPLDDLYISFLKAFQSLERHNKTYYRDPTQTDFAKLLQISPRTVLRRMNVIRLLSMVGAMHFLDMGQLGYETTLYVHSNPFPEDYEKYLLLSTNLTVGNFSVVQIPLKKSQELVSLQSNLETLISQNMATRISSWNLTGLSTGEVTWRSPPSFLHGEANIPLISPSSDVKFSLKPSFDPFRPLTPADIKILDFLTIKGSFTSIRQLSDSIQVSAPEVSKRLQEYGEGQLLLKANQYYNIGLDLTVFIFISDEDRSIPWVEHFLSFPKCDIYYQNEESPHYYFGFLKLPNYWIKAFARKIDLIKREYRVKIYYKIASSVDYAKWGIELSETYF
jgi:DNA-binding Lrp family transcriptional regulator